MPTSFELILDDSSPVVNYYPFAETFGTPDLLAGWNSYFSQSGFLSQLGETGLGESFHVTSLDGAIFTIQWFGTGISLFGSAMDAAYQVSLDGATPSIGLPRQDILAEFDGLESKQHLVALIAHPVSAAVNTSSYIAFDRAALKVDTNRTGAIVASEVVDVASPRWTFSGDWSELSDLSATSQSSQPYRECNIRGGTASIIFTGSAIILTGLRNDTHGHYNVTLDGTTTTFDGHSDWLEPSSTLFLQAGLDDAVQHTLTVTNADDAVLGLTGMNITHVNGGTLINTGNAGSNVSTGTVVGVVLAVVLGLLALATVVLCVYFRQRNRRITPTSRGVSSEDLFKPSDIGWPIRRPMHVSKDSEYSLQDLYTGAAADFIGGMGERVGRRDTAESPVLRATQRQEDMVDPTSPAPYLRASRAPSSANAQSHTGRTRSDMERDGDRKTALRGLLSTHVQPTTGDIDSGERLPGASPAPSHSTGTIKGTQSSHLLRVEIPTGNLSPATVEPVEGAASHRPRRSPLLYRDIGRGALRNSGTPSNVALPSVSTIKFARPWDGRRESVRTHTTTSSTTVRAEERVVSPGPKDAPFNLLERLRSRKIQNDIPVPSPGPSNWKPPW